ncbi:MAG: guanylate kinase [Anaerovoracaceae bacterium]
MKRQGRLLVISGPSGTGKGTICARIIEELDDIVLSVSATTRPMRKGEVHGENYYFLTREEFEEKIAAGGFLEHATVYDNYYGTPREKVFEMLENGIDVVLEIDVQGAMKVRKSYPDGVFIFILPPSMAELRKRITTRATDAVDVIELRMSKALSEIAFAEKYDYYVINDVLDEAVAEVKAIITAEHARVTEEISAVIEGYKEE